METRLLLATGHLIIGEALRCFFERNARFSVVAQAADGPRAVELAHELRPDVVLLDLWLPQLSGLEAVRRIAGSGSGSRTLILAHQETSLRVEEVLRAGASGVLLWDSEPDELFLAIDAVLRGCSYLTPALTQQVVDALGHSRPNGSRLSRLTAREREVLQLVAEGYSSKEIAVRLGVGTKTVDSHRSALMRKLEIRKAAGLALFAIRQGLVAP